MLNAIRAAQRFEHVVGFQSRRLTIDRSDGRGEVSSAPRRSPPMPVSFGSSSMRQDFCMMIAKGRRRAGGNWMRMQDSLDRLR